METMTMIHLNPVPLHQVEPTFYAFDDAVILAAELASGEEDSWTYAVIPWGGSDEPQDYVVEVRDDEGHLAGYWNDPR